MNTFTTALWIIATDTFIAAAGATREAATAEYEALLADGTIEALEDATPRFALVDNAKAPTAWKVVLDKYFCIHHAGKPLHGDADAYHFNAVAPLYATLDEAVADAESLDSVGFDTDVVEFSPKGGRSVAWGR